MAAFDTENAGLRDLVAEPERELEELRRLMADLQSVETDAEDAGPVEVDHDPGDAQRHDWRLPRHRPGMPAAGVVTLEEQPDEEYAFDPAAELMAQWRQLVNTGGQSLSRADRTQAAVRR